jgi:hypothetical protein
MPNLQHGLTGFSRRPLASQPETARVGLPQLRPRIKGPIEADLAAVDICVMRLDQRGPQPTGESSRIGTPEHSVTRGRATLPPKPLSYVREAP